ncbi:unnamed protein product [Polarella glacialis]|nr:unnamed protein product [Polarella glacialis]
MNHVIIAAACDNSHGNLKSAVENASRGAGVVPHEAWARTTTCPACVVFDPNPNGKTFGSFDALLTHTRAKARSSLETEVRAEHRRLLAQLERTGGLAQVGPRVASAPASVVIPPEVWAPTCIIPGREHDPAVPSSARVSLASSSSSSSVPLPPFGAASTSAGPLFTCPECRDRAFWSFDALVNHTKAKHQNLLAELERTRGLAQVAPRVVRPEASPNIKLGSAEYWARALSCSIPPSSEPAAPEHFSASAPSASGSSSTSAPSLPVGANTSAGPHFTCPECSSKTFGSFGQLLEHTRANARSSLEIEVRAKHRRLLAQLERTRGLAQVGSRVASAPASVGIPSEVWAPTCIIPGREHDPAVPSSARVSLASSSSSSSAPLPPFGAASTSAGPLFTCPECRDRAFWSFDALVNHTKAKHTKKMLAQLERTRGLAQVAPRVASAPVGGVSPPEARARRCSIPPSSEPAAPAHSSASFSSASSSCSSSAPPRPHGAKFEPAAQHWEISDAGDCTVCMAMPASYLVVPCGHQCLCGTCANKLTACPVCRVRVQQTIRVFASGVVDVKLPTAASVGAASAASAGTRTVAKDSNLPELVLPEDAPVGHAAHQMVRYAASSQAPSAVFQYRRGDEKIRFQTTLAAAGSQEACEVIARACYMKFEEGLSKEEVLAFRAECYAKAKATKGVSGKQAPARSKRAPRACSDEDDDDAPIAQLVSPSKRARLDRAIAK